ncbi:MAG: DNA-binding response regulator [Anaerolineae bacterium]|jgi:DNA-binding NarL/FixJ family response regulator|nr:MAG: DNA-binding response regulator [Anaerolineae bacterium]
MIHVMVVDDQAVVCDGLEMILGSDPQIQVVAKAYDGDQAVEQVAEKSPDLVLMDLKMPGMNGIQATREIKRRYPQVKVLALTTYGDDEWVFDAIRAGADGYLLKGVKRDELLQAVKGTMEGKTHVDPAVAGKLFQNVARAPSATPTRLSESLSEREVEILRLIAQGYTNAEIADKLYLTRGTVRNYVSSILEKLGVEDRTQAAILAIQAGLTER